MIESGSLLSENGAGPAQSATTPGLLTIVVVGGAVTVAREATAVVTAGELAVPAREAVGVAPDPAAELAWFPWHPATAAPSAAQRTSLLSVRLTYLKTRFGGHGCTAPPGT
jgi:hypothetical protein